MNNGLWTLGRVLLGLLFVMASVGKFQGLEGFGEFIASKGFPAQLALPVAIFEAAAGLAIITGFFTKYAAYALAAFCIFTALIYHQGDIPGMLKNLAIAGGFMVLSVQGAGPFSIDAKRG